MLACVSEFVNNFETRALPSGRIWHIIYRLRGTNYCFLIPCFIFLDFGMFGTIQ